MDVEFKADRPRPASLPPALPDETMKRDLCFENSVLRAYRVKLAAGESVRGVLAVADEQGETEGGGGGSTGQETNVGFPYLAVAMKNARLSRGEVKAGDNWWCGAEGEDSSWSNDGEHEVEVMILHPK